ncbi:MAG: Hsp70 family protein [Planctomycetes bacterium]|nr:Hsp70 family protein [Planctomycetota bacterium]
MTKRYGIDLGTTYSTISWYDESRQEVKPLPLESEDGETSSLRSVVYYPSDGQPVVGEVAWNTRKQDPDRVIVGIKRKMGDDYRTEPIDGVRRTPQEVSTEILRVLKENAEIEMGEAVTDVVITVPAYFGERQCAATMEAAHAAGLNVLNILSEPHAAAVAYSIEQAVNLTDKHVLVYDLGGGTFDVTLIKPVIPAEFKHAGEVQNLTLNTLCKDGNRELGGLDWDEVLIDLVAEKCIEQFEVDPRLDPRNAAILHDNCERAKRALSKKPTEMVVADLQGHMVEVTREEFEERSSGLLLQTQMRMEQVLHDAETNHGVTRDMIDILVCGGATRMPMVKEMIERIMGREPLEYRNPQLLVACGAAYVAHALDPQATIPLPGPSGELSEESRVRITEDSITDITCHAVGIQVIRQDANGERKPFNAVVLERGVVFGERRDFITETLFDNQTEVCIRLFEGDSESVEECTHLMDFRIEGLPANRPRGRPIRTTLWFGMNGIIMGKAVDLETNTEIDIHYDRWGNGKNQAAKPAPAQRAAAPAPAAERPAIKIGEPSRNGSAPAQPAAAKPAAPAPRPSAPAQPAAAQPATPVQPTAAKPVAPAPQPAQPAAPAQPQPVNELPPLEPAAPAQTVSLDEAQPEMGDDESAGFDPARPFGDANVEDPAPVNQVDEAQPSADEAAGLSPISQPQDDSSNDNDEMPRPLKLY